MTDRMKPLAGTMIALLTLTAIAAWPGRATAQAAPAEPPFPTATPESQGLSSSSLVELVDTVRDMHARDLFLGAELVIIKNRHLVLHETFGVSDREREIAWQPNTICNIRSMSKPLTGAAIQILIDRGRIQLDDPAAKFLPAFDNETLRAITIGHLLSHQSGLPLTAVTTSVDQFEDLQSQVASLAEAELRFEPGTDFWYSDAGTDTLGAIVEVISGQTLDAFINDELLTPLGMSDSFYGIHDDEPRFARTASLYIGGPDAWTRFWQPNDGALYPCAWGSQTIYATPLDYAQFLCMWMDEGKARDGTPVLSPEAVRRTLTPATPMKMLGSDARFPTDFAGLETFYGQMAVLHVPTDGDGADNSTDATAAIIGHSGSDGTIAWAWPERDLMILFFTQSRGGSAVLRLEDPIERLILHPEQAAANATVPEEVRPLLGTYIANFAAFENEPFEVLYRNGKLALDIPSQMVFELMEPNEKGHRAFAIAPDQIFVTFERDADGAVNRLKLHQGEMVFDVPRKGTALAAEQAKRPTIDAEAVKPFIGRYDDPTSDAFVDIFFEGETLCIKSTSEGVVLHLRATEDSRLFTVKQAPMVRLRFEVDGDGIVTGMTRIIGESVLTMPRVNSPE